MKFLKKAALIGSFALLPLGGFSQGEASIEEGNVLINPGITLGWYSYGYGYDLVNVLPPVSLNFEYASSDLLSFGMEAEYGLRNYRDFNFGPSSYSYKYEYKYLGVRGSFHYLDLLKNLLEDNLGGVNSSSLDFYIGASAGVLVTQSTQTWSDTGVGEDHKSRTFDSSFKFGYMLGFRYYMSNNFGFFLETGRNNLGWAKVGLTLKI